MNNETPIPPPSVNHDETKTSEQGESWKKLRESKGISLDTIVQQTNIPLRKLEALENKEFDALGNETFALGYIRRYAKILKVDPELFIESYKNSRPTGDITEIPSAQEPNFVKEEKSNFGAALRKKKIPLMPISIAVIVVWIIAMVFIGGDDDVESPAQQSAPVSDNTESTVDDDVLIQKDVLPLEKPKASPLAEENTLSTTSTTAQTEEEINPYVAEPPPASRIPVETPVPDVAERREGSEPMGDAPVEVVHSDNAEDAIMMSFSDDCWVEVRDASDEVIFAQLQLKGDNLQIFGRAPFDVMLGNAKAVTMTINGREVSTDPPGGQKTLRLTLNR